MFNLSDRTRGEFVFLDANLEHHLAAIKCMLKRNEQAAVAHIDKIRQRERNAECAPNDKYGQHLADLAVDAMHDSVYHDAANSMAAVGMLAPLIESLFVHLFKEFRNMIVPAQGRRSRLTEDRYWDPRWYAASNSNDRQDLLLGFKQLANEIGLDAFLPSSLEATVAALLAYRNNMFHNGFEWPKERREAFAKRISDEGWSAWFSRATTNDEPWIFYMTQEFILHCLTLIDELVIGVGRFHRRVEENKAKKARA